MDRTHPILLGALLVDLLRQGREKTLKGHRLDHWVLLGELPAEVLPAAANTRLSVRRTPTALEEQGITLDMVCWPLRRHGLPFAKTTIRLGRDVDSDLVLPHPDMSKRHANLVLGGTRLWFEDQESANGSVVNRVAAVPHTPIEIVTGAHLTLGGMELQAMETTRLLDLLESG